MVPPRSQIELPLDFWLQEVLKELPKATRSHAEQTPSNNHEAKLRLEYEVPMIGEAAQRTAAISGPYQVNHLQLSIDITSVVHFEKQGGQTVCVLPHKAFPVNTKPDAPKEQQIDLANEQSDDISDTYRAYILSVLQLIKRFPDLTHLDIDIIGSIPNRSADILHALSANSLALYRYVNANLPRKLNKITLLCGHTLDVYGLAAKPSKFKKKTYEWALKETFKVIKGQDVDQMNLGDVRAVLRSDKAVSIYPKYHCPAGAMLPKPADEDVDMAEAGAPDIVVTAPSPAVGESALSPPIESMDVESPLAENDDDEDTGSHDKSIPASEIMRNEFAEHVYESLRSQKGKGRVTHDTEPDLDYRQDSAAVQPASATPEWEDEELHELFH